jgi:hypothetical protein
MSTSSRSLAIACGVLLQAGIPARLHRQTRRCVRSASGAGGSITVGREIGARHTIVVALWHKLI